METKTKYDEGEKTPAGKLPGGYALPRFISVAGLIGAGKTTLADDLGRWIRENVSHDVQVHHENVAGNRILPLFYQDMSRWAFVLQASLLTTRHAQLQRIQWSERPYHIEDRLLDEDMVFARVLCAQGHMRPEEYAVYRAMVDTFERHARRPDLVVFLDVSPETAYERIQQRGRPMEVEGCSLEYLRVLHAEYARWLPEFSRRVPTIRISWEEFSATRDAASLIANRWATRCQNIVE